MKINNNNEKKLVPELRFPEFESDGEWEEKTIGEFAPLQRGFDLPIDNIVAGNYPVVFSNGILKYHNEYKVKGPGVVTGRSGTIGKITYVQDDFWPHNTSLWVTDFCNNYPLFVFYYFTFIGLEQFGTYGGIPTLNRNDVHRHKVSVPNKIQEQQKIGNCLSSLDELTAAHTNKLEAFKDHKKGLLQNLFPQEGETMPKYRFPEFDNEARWVSMKLGDEDISVFINEKITNQKLRLDSYISTENMLPNFSGVTSASKLPATGNVTKFIEGDILISNIRPYLKKVWKSDKQGGASNDVLVFRAGQMVHNEFLECLLKNDSFINYVMKNAGGVKMPRGDKDSIQEYPVLIPQKKEQQKIASCFSALDKLITAQVGKIEQLQLHKKGLMQGLFPVVD